MFDIRVAIVGTGFMGPVHVEALRRLGVPVAGIMGSSHQKSEEACTALGLAKAYATYDELLSDDKVQAVHLCVPNMLHFDMAKRALLAGKHVMCEKPLAMNSQESSALLALAQRKNLAAGVCYNLRFYPLNIHARQMVKSDQLGRIFHVNGSYVQDWLLYDTDYNWRLLREKSGDLRAVSDIGTHWMDMLQMITGLEIEAVFADLKIFYETRKRPQGEVKTYSHDSTDVSSYEDVAIDTEDSGSILFRFKGGATGCLHVSQVTAGRKNAIRYEIAGSQQAVAWDSERPNEMWIGHRDRPNEVILRDPSLMAPEAAAYSSCPGGHNEGYSDTFKQCFKAFYKYIAAGDFSAPADFPSFEDGHHEILLCEAILESSRREKWVKIKG